MTLLVEHGRAVEERPGPHICPTCRGFKTALVRIGDRPPWERPCSRCAGTGLVP